MKTSKAEAAKKPKVLARILLTNGKRTIQLYWIRHHGTDVYHGMPEAGSHESHHGSGRRHTRYDDGTVKMHEAGPPLKDIKGVFAVDTVGFNLNYSSPPPRRFAL